MTPRRISSHGYAQVSRLGEGMRYNPAQQEVAGC